MPKAGGLKQEGPTLRPALVRSFLAGGGNFPSKIMKFSLCYEVNRLPKLPTVHGRHTPER